MQAWCHGKQAWSNVAAPAGEAGKALRRWACGYAPLRMPTSRKKLGALSLAALGVNTIVGAGIFRLPAELARDLGPLSIFAHALGALLLVPIALSYAEAGGMLEGDGGAYSTPA
jgi:amino acid transporter